MNDTSKGSVVITTRSCCLLYSFFRSREVINICKTRGCPSITWTFFFILFFLHFIPFFYLTLPSPSCTLMPLSSVPWEAFTHMFPDNCENTGQFIHQISRCLKWGFDPWIMVVTWGQYTASLCTPSPCGYYPIPLLHSLVFSTAWQFPLL